MVLQSPHAKNKLNILLLVQLTDSWGQLCARPHCLSDKNFCFIVFLSVPVVPHRYVIKTVCYVVVCMHKPTLINDNRFLYPCNDDCTEVILLRPSDIIHSCSLHCACPYWLIIQGLHLKAFPCSKRHICRNRSYRYSNQLPISSRKFSLKLTPGSRVLLKKLTVAELVKNSPPL
jgi:hypothetical protein